MLTLFLIFLTWPAHLFWAGA